MHMPRMNITFPIPDDLVDRQQQGGKLPRMALEALAVEGYLSGRLSYADTKRMLDLNSDESMRGILRAHDVGIEAVAAPRRDGRPVTVDEWMELVREGRR